MCEIGPERVTMSSTPAIPLLPTVESSSLIRVKRCRKCNGNFLLGQSPRSPYYKPCRCGGSDIERKRHEWTPMTKLQFMDTPTGPPSSLSIHPPNPLATPPPPVQTSFLLRQVDQTWNGFSHHFRIASRRSKKVGETLGKALRQKATEVCRQFLKPELPSQDPPPRRFQKRNASIRTHFGRIRVSFASIRRRFGVSVTSACSSRTSASAEQQPETQTMYDTQKVKGQPGPMSTFEYENEAFEEDQPVEEVGIRKRLPPMSLTSQNDEAIPKSGSTEQHDERKRDGNIYEENFTIGSTSSLIVAVLSYASFAYFVMWLVLYSATLDLILPEMKYLHKYVTVCSLLLMVSLNCFRFYITRNADKNQNTYLFTGTKTLTVLVIGALTSLLVTDSYSEPPRAFHVIISAIMMTLLILEGIALFIHQRLP